MTLSVVWSVQARNQFVATLTFIAKEDPLSAELVHQRVEKSRRSSSCAISQKWVLRPPQQVCEPTPYPKPATALTIGWCAVKSGFSAGTDKDRSL